MTRHRIAVIGAGLMGSLHARTLARLDATEVGAVIDTDADRAKALAADVGGAWATSLDDCAELESCVAAIVASPTPTHRDLSIQLLQAGLHVLVEKPMALSSEQALEMIAAATAADRVLAVGHIERFNPVSEELVRYAREPLFVQSHRLSSWEPRISDGVILDLMLHDIDLVMSFDASPVRTVTAATIMSRSQSEDLATCTMELESGLVCQFNSSRISQRKTRTMQVTLPDAVIDADLLMRTLTISRQTSDDLVGEGGSLRYRQHTVTEIPYLGGGEPLPRELKDFVNAIEGHATPRVGGEMGLEAIRRCELVYEAAGLSDARPT